MSICIDVQVYNSRESDAAAALAQSSVVYVTLQLNKLYCFSVFSEGRITSETEKCACGDKK